MLISFFNCHFLCLHVIFLDFFFVYMLISFFTAISLVYMSILFLGAFPLLTC